MSQQSYDHATNLLGAAFLALLWLGACCLVVGLAVYGLASALSGAHDKLGEIRTRREKARAARLAAADKILRSP
jgi:hypothetical protein